MRDENKLVDVLDFNVNFNERNLDFIIDNYNNNYRKIILDNINSILSCENIISEEYTLNFIVLIYIVAEVKEKEIGEKLIMYLDSEIYVDMLGDILTEHYAVIIFFTMKIKDFNSLNKVIFNTSNDAFTRMCCIDAILLYTYENDIDKKQLFNTIKRILKNEEDTMFYTLVLEYAVGLGIVSMKYAIEQFNKGKINDIISLDEMRENTGYETFRNRIFYVIPEFKTYRLLKRFM